MKKNSRSYEYIPALRYDVLTTLFDPLIQLFLKEEWLRAYILREANLQPRQAILDVGSGTGTFSLFAKKLYPDIQVFGIDGDRKALSIAAKKANESGLSITFLEARAEALPFRDHHFDAIFSTLVFHHLPTDIKCLTLKEIFRVLKPGHYFYLGDWGKPGSLDEKWLFYLVQLLDGFKMTQDNREGKLPLFLAEVGFVNVEEIKRKKTLFGVFSFYRAKKAEL